MVSFADIVAEIVEHRARNESVDSDSYLRQYPEHAEALRKFLDDMDLIGAILTVPTHAHRTRPSEDGTERVPPNGFQLLKELRRGAQGVVYQAIQRSTGRIVALKMLHSGTALHSSHEARLVARLRHPNVITVFEAGEFEGRPYYAMEFVDGEPLDSYVTQHKLDLRSKLRLFIKICDGVMCAHHRGIIHRDLKPSNILVDCDSEPRVLDFGLARRVTNKQSASQRANEDDRVGTLSYSSPEQAAGPDENVDTRSDIYSLGIILFELLAMRLPYVVPDDPSDALEVIKRFASKRPSLKCRELDRDLECIVLKATEINPDRRYQSVGAMGDEVRQYLNSRPISQRQHQSVYVAHRFVRRNRNLIVSTMTVIAIVAILGFRLISLTTDKRARIATAHRRFELARHRNLQMLSEYQKHVASTNQLRQIERLTHNQAAQYLARYKNPLVNHDQVLRTVVEEIPDTTLASLRVNPSILTADEHASLSRIDEPLDSLAMTLAEYHMVFALKQDRYLALGWDRRSISDATDLCGAFIGRAFRRHAQGNDEGAIADVRAATLLASDVGDGVLLAHKAYAYRCHTHILDFLRLVLIRSFENNAYASPYTEVVLAYPELPLVSSSLRPVCLGIHELLDIALVANSSGSGENLNLYRLDEFLEGFFEQRGMRTQEHFDRFRQHTSADFFALTDRYILSAKNWDSLNAFQIQTESAAIEQEIVRERTQNPLLWLLNVPAATFLERLEVCSRRQSLRIVAHAGQYRAKMGHWPEGLTEIVPRETSDESIDPRTGLEFEYDICNNMPRLRSRSSARTSLAYEADEAGSELGTKLETYFPLHEQG